MHAEDLLKLGVIDQIIREPVGGAHLNPQEVYTAVKAFIKEQWNLLKSISPPTLLEIRYQKFRKMGKFDSLTDVNHEAPVTGGPPQ